MLVGISRDAAVDPRAVEAVVAGGDSSDGQCVVHMRGGAAIRVDTPADEVARLLREARQ